MQVQDISDQKMLFFLSEIPGFGAASIQRLYEKIKPLSRLLHIEEKELLEFEILRRDQIHALLLEQKNWLEIEERYQELTERKIAFVTPLEPNYPDKLRQIHHPPMGLYVRGQLPLWGVEMPANMEFLWLESMPRYWQKMAYKSLVV